MNFTFTYLLYVEFLSRVGKVQINVVLPLLHCDMYKR